MNPSRIVPVAFVLVSMVASLSASVRQVQIYAIVERVVFEPSEAKPERVRVYGAFALLYTNQEPVSNSDNGPYSPQKGFLYFKLPSAVRGDTAELPQQAAKREWADLKSVAGTGQAIMFGSWTSYYLGEGRHRESGFVGGPENDEVLRVHESKERSPSAIPYTMDTGITKVPSQGKFADLTAQLQDKLR
jgi:hypothetical protein